MIKLPKRVEDLAGKQFNSWFVLEYAGQTENKQSTWWCKCKCGKIKKTVSYNLKSGASKGCSSCGRRGKLKVNAKYRSPIFRVWGMMIQRCYNPKYTHYSNYGGRGIIVCDRWKDGPDKMLEDLGPRLKNTTLDRIDNNGPYSPENCRWATRKQQSRNMRSNRLLTYKGQTKCMTDWAKIVGMPRATLDKRISKLQWPIEKALVEPVN